MSFSLILLILWTSSISICLGAVLGMAVTMRYQRRMLPPVKPEPIPQPEVLPQRDEILVLLRKLLETNAKVDARVEQHSVRVEEITESIESEITNDPNTLVRAAKLLVAANRQLQGDLASTKTELQEQRQLVDAFKRESRTDALTDLLNRRAFEGEINGCLEQRGVQTFSLLFVDIDHFKNVNDRYGHLNGDQVLSTVAKCLKSNLRVPASVSRYGGEEFAIVLPGTSGRKALEIAEQLRRSVEEFPHDIEGQELNITVSIGVTEVSEGDTRSELLERADQALFAAKNAGRNFCSFCACHQQRASNLCAAC